MMEQIIQVLKTIRPEFDFVGVDDFFSRGMLDSFDLTLLISSLEERFGIAVDGGDIVPENFRNTEAIALLLRKYNVGV
jgi:acyl carrier protein